MEKSPILKGRSVIRDSNCPPQTLHLISSSFFGTPHPTVAIGGVHRNDPDIVPLDVGRNLRVKGCPSDLAPQQLGKYLSSGYASIISKLATALRSATASRPRCWSRMVTLCLDVHWGVGSQLFRLDRASAPQS